MDCSIKNDGKIIGMPTTIKNEAGHVSTRFTLKQERVLFNFGCEGYLINLAVIHGVKPVVPQKISYTQATVSDQTDIGWYRTAYLPIPRPILETSRFVRYWNRLGSILYRPLPRGRTGGNWPQMEFS
jgi:hypothetical protein